MKLFSNHSIWNTRIAANTLTHPRSDEWISLLKREPYGAFGVNSRLYTIPIYFADTATPLVRVHQRPAPPKGFETSMDGFLDTRRAITFSHGPGFGLVPIPAKAVQDKGTDGHLAIIDPAGGMIHDLWGARIREDGEWESYTGMAYPISGDGIFRREEATPRIVNGDSVHQHGPSRAAGVPAIAGIVFKDEVIAGHISHKLAFGCRFNGFQTHVPPATWTDGQWPGGLPEGCLIQLDPSLDLKSFGLPKGELAVARALQEYGAINVDLAGANTVYAERKLDEDEDNWGDLFSTNGDFLKRIPLDSYRVIDTGPAIPEGDRESHRWLYEPLGIADHPLRSACSWR